jgi:hypothetical protein
MQDRRLVGIDLGITSVHTVRVLAGDGSLVCRRKAVPTRQSLTEVEQAALARAAPGTRLEVVLEPTGPAWLPIAVFFCARGHTVYRVSSGLVPMTCAECRTGTPRPTASTPTPWPASRWSTRPGCTPWSCRARSGRPWTAGCGPPTGSPRPPPTSAASRTWSASSCPVAPWLVILARPTWPCWNAPAATPRPGGHRPSPACPADRQDLQPPSRCPRATQWLTAAQAALELYGDHPAVASTDLAAEVQSEVRLLRATQAELDQHAPQREACYRWVDPGALARSLPGLAEVGAPALVATMGHPSRFATAAKFRSCTGLAPKASETGQSDRKGQPISKAGNRLLRTTLVRAADHARRQDPQLARLYWIQMVQRGKDHLGALCVVAAHLAERAWTVMDRAMPYVICDTDGTPVTVQQAKAIIAEHWTVPEEVRRRRRHKKGKALNKSTQDMSMALEAQRGDPPLATQSWTANPARQASPTTHLTTHPP